MPVPQQAEKTEHEQKLWVAIKRHILSERKRKKEELEAEVEEERQRREREATEKKNAMTLGETREQIQILERKLEELKKQKGHAFTQYKEVLNKDDNRKRQSRDVVPQESFPVVSKAMPHVQPIFLPPRVGSYPPQSNSNSVPVKRKRSPSPSQNQIYHRAPPSQQQQMQSQAAAQQQQQQHPDQNQQQQPPPSPQQMMQQRNDDRRTNDGRAVLWTAKPTQYRPGAISYPAQAVSQQQQQPPPPPQHGQPKPQIYPFPLGLRPGGYMIPSQHQGQPPTLKDVGQNKQTIPASIYHIESRPPPQIKTVAQPPPGSERHIYHAEIKHPDDRPELRPAHFDLQGIRREQIHLYQNPNILQIHQQPQVVKSGSITQGYPTRSPSSNQPPHPNQNPHYAGLLHHRY